MCACAILHTLHLYLLYHQQQQHPELSNHPRDREKHEGRREMRKGGEREGKAEGEGREKGRRHTKSIKIYNEVEDSCNC